MNLVFISSYRGRVLLVLILAPVVTFSATLVQNAPPTPPADASSPVLIWDVKPNLDNSWPRNFRTTDDPLNTNEGQIPADTGLADLRASGGGEFTSDGVKLLLARTRGPVMRQETHVFVNGLPISWFATHDWANVGRTQAATEADEAARVQSLKPGSEIVVAAGDAIKKPGVDSAAPRRLTVEHASTESDIVKSNNAAYVRLIVTDHARPLDDEVDRFVLALRALPANGWAHFHCEAGRGRTTTFMALYDMLRNANRVSLEDIARREQLLGYDYDVLRPVGPESWKAPYSVDRIAFVRAFYNYARANPGGRPQLWSEWLKSGAN